MMSKTITIVTSKVNRLGNTLVFAHGEEKVGKDGKVDVPADVAKNLVENGLGWDYADGAPEANDSNDDSNDNAPEGNAPEANDNEGNNTPESNEGNEPEANEGNDEEVDLSKLGITKLKELCAAANLPKDEWNGFKGAEGKKKLIKYIEKKIK